MAFARRVGATAITRAAIMTDDVIADAVLERIRKLGKARFNVICAGLPYARDSISQAIRRLRDEGQVRLHRDRLGEFWQAVRQAPTETH